MKPKHNFVVTLPMCLLFFLSLFSITSPSAVIPPSNFLSFTGGHSSIFMLNSYIFKNTSPYKSSSIIYPFPLTINGEEHPKGGIFDLSGKAVFESLEAIKAPAMELPKKGKALYRTNLAALSVTTTYNEEEGREMLFDADQFCYFYTTNMGYRAVFNVTDLDSELAEDRNVVKINRYDILNGALSHHNISSIAVGDYVLNTESIIDSYITPDVVEILKKFVEDGGTMIVTGKAGYLLEKWNILKPGTYNTKYVLASYYGKINVTECDSSLIDPDDFVDNINCENYQNTSYLLSTFPIYKNHSNTDVKILSYYQNSEYNKQYITLKEMGTDALKYLDQVTNITQDYYPHFMRKIYGRGNIFIFNSNPLYQFENLNQMTNIMFYSMTRNGFYFPRIENESNQPMPFGENTLELKVNLDFINLYNTSIANYTTHIYLSNYYMEYLSYNETQCTPCEDNNDLEVKEINFFKLGLNQTTHIKCFVSNVAPQQNVNYVFKLNLISEKVTNLYANSYNVLYTTSSFYDLENDTALVLKDGTMLSTKVSRGAYITHKITNDKYISSTINGNINKNKHSDSIYLSNLQNTKATNLEYIGVLPLISPILDSDDKGVYVKKARFFNEYYKARNLTVDAGSSDYLDVKFLNGKKTVFVPEWDMAVTVQKEVRTDDVYGVVEGASNLLDIENLNYSLTVDDINTVIKQTAYQSKSNTFFGKSTQKLICFAEDKIDFAWLRYDIKFESGKMPSGVSSNNVISIDSLNNEYVKGKFNVDEGLIPSQYENSLLKQYANLYKSGTNEYTNQVKKINYLMVLNDNGVTKASDIEGFVDENNESGYMSAYPDVKFLYGYNAKVTIPKKEKKSQGGKIIFKLTDNIIATPFEENQVYYTTSNVVVHKTEYESATNSLIVYYRTNDKTYTQSTIEITITKSQNALANFSAKASVYEMSYDINAPDTLYHVYTETSSFEISTVTFTKKKYFSLPAIEYILSVSSFNGNVNLSSLSKYSLYVQELQTHSTLYTSMESHHTTDPGVQLTSQGYAILTSIGSISTRNYFISPLTNSISRIDYFDLWGREWSYPIEASYREVASFSCGNNGKTGSLGISVTYDMLLNGERTLLWPSNEDVTIVFKVKVSNNYEKYFEPTICKENEYIYNVNTDNETKNIDRVYDGDYSNVSKNDGTGDYIAYGHTDSYGVCYKDSQCILSGVNVTDYESIKNGLKLCSYSNINTCSNDILNILNLGRKGKDGSSPYNYSPYVTDYYPEGYITQNMWDMTSSQYDNTKVSKGYKYHMDNLLPSAENKMDKLHNLITFPIINSNAYQIKYSKDYTLPNDDTYSGWWSDNLQNNDNTIISGSGDNELNWSSPSSSDIYSCLFNNKRVLISLTSSKYAYTKNIFDNYIIPVLPSYLEEIPTDVTTCEKYYTGYNISKYESNFQKTNSDINYMYFSSAVRGGAKESFNIITQLSNIHLHEGLTKILDNVKFKYWNPNSKKGKYTTVQTNPIAITGQDNNIKIDVDILPELQQGYYGDAYIFITLTDENEYNREYTGDIYDNSHGYGDIMTSVYVGEIDGTSCRVKPGEKTIFKIAMVNNGGIDFDLLKTAIEYTVDPESEEEPINSNLLKDYVHSVQNPTKINFVSFQIPEEFSSYINISPSDHFSTTSPQYFDYLNINPSSIKDGMESSYYFNLNVSPDFPTEYKGKMFEIPVVINTTYFNNFIDENRNITFPPIKIGIPQESTGKVFYSLGYATNFTIRYKSECPQYTRNDYTITLLEEEDVSKLREYAKNFAFQTEMRLLLFKYNKNGNSIKATYLDSNKTEVLVNMSSFLPQFPKKRENKTDSGKAHIMIAIYSTFPYGKFKYISNLNVTYNDYRGIPRIVKMSPNERWVDVRAPKSTLKTSYRVVGKDQDETYLANNMDYIYLDDLNVNLEFNLYMESVGSYGLKSVRLWAQVAGNIVVDAKNVPPNFIFSTFFDSKLPGYRCYFQNTEFLLYVGERYNFRFYGSLSPRTLRNLLEGATQNQDGDYELEVIYSTGISFGLEQTGENGEELRGEQTFAEPVKLTIKNEYRKKVASKVELLNKTKSENDTTSNDTFYFGITATPDREIENGYKFVYSRKIMLNNKTVITYVNITNETTERYIEDTVNFTSLGLSVTNETNYTIIYMVEEFDSKLQFLSRSISHYEKPTNKEVEKITKIDSKETKNNHLVIILSVGGILIFTGLIMMIVFLFCKLKRKDKIIKEIKDTEKKTINDDSVQDVPVVIGFNEKRKDSIGFDKETVATDQQMKPNFIRIQRRSDTTGALVKRNNYQVTE